MKAVGGCGLQFSATFFPAFAPFERHSQRELLPSSLRSPPSRFNPRLCTPGHHQCDFPTSQPHFLFFSPDISCLLHHTLMHLCSHLCAPLAWVLCRVSQVWFVVDLSDWLLEERLLRAQVTSRCNSCVIAKPPFGQVGYEGPPFLCVSVFSGFWVSDVVRMG
jgi:hypothetical protein